MVHASKAELPRLSAAHWPTGAYRREDLPERVLQFGTGMLLRALCATFVDAANTAGTFSGRSVVIQSTPHGQARALNAQDGLFTLVERGLEHGAPVERTRLIGAISRALIADAEWPAVRDLVARPELQVRAHPMARHGPSTPRMVCSRWWSAGSSTEPRSKGPD